MTSKTIRILQVIPSVDYSGVLLWLQKLLSHMDRSQFQMDFLVRDIQHIELKQRLEALDANILYVPGDPEHYHIKPDHLRQVADIVRRNGPYQVIHCHEGLDSWLYLVLGAYLSIPMRIVHSHSGYIRLRDWFSPHKTMVRVMKRKLISQYATHGFSSGPQNATALFGRYWMKDGRWHNLFCGMDLAPFERVADRKTRRVQMGIPPDALVLGHVGQFWPTKHHDKIVSVFRALLKKRPNAYLVLVGDGQMMTTVEWQVASYGLTDRVVFMGAMDDAIEVMQDVMDVFILPSVFEGLGFALLEAQAVGLPCVVSDTIPKCIEVVSEQVIRLLISDKDEDWVNRILACAHRPRERFSRRVYSRFDVMRSIKIWQRVYRTGTVFN